jgi:hypothetical protein
MGVSSFSLDFVVFGATCKNFQMLKCNLLKDNPFDIQYVKFRGQAFFRIQWDARIFCLAHNDCALLSAWILYPLKRNC